MLAGGATGFLLAYVFPINSALGLTPALTEVACALAGLALGYMGSSLLDVFLTPSE
jgi:hypothetical protein